MATNKIQHRPIDGVLIQQLTPHHDSRGQLVEMYRENWGLGSRSVQFNAVTSAAGVVRGVHAHIRHFDHLFVASGAMTLGLQDIRPWSPTAGVSCQIELEAGAPRAVIVPPGVAHGFYFTVPSILLYGVSHYWNPDDEIACRWDCPELGITWPARSATLSERDAQADTYADFVSAFLRGWREAYGTVPDRSTQ